MKIYTLIKKKNKIGRLIVKLQEKENEIAAKIRLLKRKR